MKAIMAMSMKVSSAFLSYVFLFSLSNTLEVGALGLFLFSYTVFTVLVQISKSGIDIVLIKAVTSQVSLGGIRGVLISNFLLIFVISFLFSFLFFLASITKVFDVIDSNEKILGFSLILVSIVLISLVQVFGALFQSRYKVFSQYWAMNVGLMAFLTTGLFVCSVLNVDLTFIDICIVFLGGAILVFLTVVGLFYVQLGAEIGSDQIDSTSETYSIYETFKSNIPYMAAALLMIFLQWMPNLLGGIFMTEEELGGLGVSIRLSIAANFPFIALVALTAPSMAAYLRVGDMVGLRSVYLQYHAISLSFASAVLMFFILCSEFMLGMFGISGYDRLLVLCTLAWWIRIAVGPVGAILMLSGRYRAAITSLFASVTISTSVFIVGYSHLGIDAAGWGLVAGATQLAVFNSVQVFRMSGPVYVSPRYYFEGLKSLFERVSSKVG